VLGLSDAEVITGLPRPAEQTTSAAPAASRHGSIAILSERGGVRVSAASGNEEGARPDELFKSESDIAVRTLTDSARF